MPHIVPIEYVNFYRNIKGRYDLLCFLFKWDPDYRKDVTMTGLSILLCVYSVLTWNSAYDLVAFVLEFGLLFVALGTEMSILPVDYRPSYNGVVYSVAAGTHVAYDEQSFPMSAVRPNAVEERLGFRNPILGKGLSQETPLVSDAVDDALMLRPKWPYKIDKTDKNYIFSRHQLRYIAIRIANKKQHTTNGKKISLYCLADALTGAAPLQVGRTCYFDSLLTGEAFRSRIFRANITGEKEVYTDLSTYFPVTLETAADGQDVVRFTPDFYNKVAGQVGISSLLITENRRVAMMHQGTTKAVGAQTVFLGGSGSLDYDDREKTGDFREVVLRGLARETCEETGMDETFLEEIYANTRVTGFFRWVDRCGKPEFLGITRAGGVPIFAGKSIDGDEVVKFEEIPVTIDTLADFARALDYIRDNKIKVGLSSLMSLHRMAVIATYDRPDATPEQRAIYKEMADFLSPGA
jgi:hypothetical protein